MTTTDAPHQLSDDTQALAKDFQLTGARIGLPEAALASWTEKFQKVAKKDRKEKAEELVALGLKFKRLAGPQADLAIRQLCELAAGLLGSEKKAGDLFAKADLGGTAAKVTGASPVKLSAPREGEKAPMGSIKAGSLPNFPRRR